METRFKEKCTFEERLAESSRIKQKYPDRIPIIVEKAKSCNNIDDITKHKYLVPKNLTMGQLIYVIRKKITTLDSHKAMFVFINKEMPATGDMVSVLFDKHVDEDGFMYIEYSGENAFG